MRRKKILIDLSVLENRPFTGVEFYAREIANRLAGVLPDFEISAALGRAEIRDEQLPGIKIFRGRSYPRSLWRRHSLKKLALETQAAILFAPISHVPRSDRFISLRTIHDLGRNTSKPNPLDVPTIVPSQATLAALEKKVPSLSAPRRVIHHGVDEDCFALPRQPAKSPRALVLGTYRDRRQPDLVAAAAAIVARRVDGFCLHWIGKGTDGLPDRPGLRFRGYLDRQALLSELSQAQFLLAPSLVEGFGLPVLEAMAAGVPVLAQDGPIIAEIGGDMVSHFDGHDPEDLALAMTAMLVDAANPAESDLRAWAQRFNWDRSAEEHAAFCLELLEEG